MDEIIHKLLIKLFYKTNLRWTAGVTAIPPTVPKLDEVLVLGDAVVALTAVVATFWTVAVGLTAVAADADAAFATAGVTLAAA